MLKSELGEDSMDVVLLKANILRMGSGCPHWPEEVEGMIQEISPSAKRPYRLVGICPV